MDRQADQLTTKEIICELQREHDVRRTIFPRLVEAGKLSQGEADRRTAAIAEAIVVIRTLFHAGIMDHKALVHLLTSTESKV